MRQNGVMDKMKSALLTGREINAENAMKVLKSDAYRLLGDYFIFEPQNFKMTVNLRKDGGVSLTLTLDAQSFRETGKVLD